MTLRFGTDGVRGPASELTDELVIALGRAAASVLGGRRFVIGRDTRESGPSIEAALISGLAAEGVECELVGVAPTPAVAWISAAHAVPAAMISASHNPFGDNGIKFFASGGLKLLDSVERRLEEELDALLAGSTAQVPVPAGGRRSERGTGDVDRWKLGMANSIEGRRLDGLRVVIDCANGSASVVAPDLLTLLGAKVTVLHAEPDGRNINAGCGSTHPEDLQRAVVAEGAMVGLAFDGDADRVLAVDENGALVDGDHLIAMCAIDMRARGLLARETVVVTLMTNLGFRLSMAEHGIAVVETQVGDRYVLEAIEAGGYNLGGEQSGHVIFRDQATTGDGLLTGVQLLDLLVRADQPLSKLAAASMTRLPQVLRNVRVVHPDPAIAETIGSEIAAVASDLGERGRILVRTSGTEPLVRVMVEAPEVEVADAAAQVLVEAVERVLGRS